MNRIAAKLLSVTGVFCCLLSAILWFLNISKNVGFQQAILLLLFVSGIILLVISLAYYTEK